MLSHQKMIFIRMITNIIGLTFSHIEKFLWILAHSQTTMHVGVAEIFKKLLSFNSQ